MATGGSQTVTEALEHFRWTKCERRADGRDVSENKQTYGFTPAADLRAESRATAHISFLRMTPNIYIRTRPVSRPRLELTATRVGRATINQRCHIPFLYLPFPPTCVWMHFSSSFSLQPVTGSGGASPRIPIKPASCFLPSVVSHVHAASDQPLHLESVTNTRGSDVRHVNITFNWIYANLFWSTDHSNTGHFHPFLHTSYTDDRDIRVSSQYKILLILWTEIQYLPISQMLIMMWFWFQSNSGSCDRYETLSSVRLTQPVTEGRCSSFFFCFLAKKKTTTHYRFKSPSLLTEHHGWISVHPFFSASHWWNRAADAVAVTAAS